MNYELSDYFFKRENPVNFVRSRAYKKNDKDKDRRLLKNMTLPRHLVRGFLNQTKFNSQSNGNFDIT